MKSDEFIEITPSKAKNKHGILLSLALPPVAEQIREFSISQKVFATLCCLNSGRGRWYCFGDLDTFLHRAINTRHIVISKTSIDAAASSSGAEPDYSPWDVQPYSEHCGFYVRLFHSETVFGFEELCYLTDDSVSINQNTRIWLISCGTIPDWSASIFLVRFFRNFEGMFEPVID